MVRLEVKIYANESCFIIENTLFIWILAFCERLSLKKRKEIQSTVVVDWSEKMKNFEVRVCVSEECNFKCKYCKPGGEGVCTGDINLSVHQLVEIVKVLKQMGCTSVRLTGGEPLLRNDIMIIVEALKKLVDVSLVTNGSMLSEKMVQDLKCSKISSVTVSLDTLDKDKFKDITGVDCLDNVLNGIEKLVMYNIPTRINTVVSRGNIDEIHKIIEFGKEKRISVKLLDYVFNEYNEWEKEYIILQPLINKLNQLYKHSISYPAGGFGTPMDMYDVGNINVLVKDNMKGTCYSEMCKKCKDFPCQSGVVSLVLAHNGLLKLCTTSNYVSIDMNRIILGSEGVNNLKDFINNYQQSKLQNLWTRC